MTGNFRALSSVDRVIHEPARTMIVAILYNLESADFLYLQREAVLTKGNLSAHLAKLEEAGYVRIEKSFHGKTPMTLCSLTEDGRKAFDLYRQTLKQFITNE
jgi:DNA-binding MarR family transcriptional regulator